jgi:hypothetical protein
MILKRGRTSMLEDVEDDDIVNQNSSKSSSRSASKKKGEEVKEELKEAVLRESVAARMLVNQQTQVSRLASEESQTKSDKGLNKSLTSRSSRKKSGRTPGANKDPSHPHNRLTYLAASGLSDDRWLCPICLDIYEDAVETPCCHNLFCE